MYKLLVLSSLIGLSCAAVHRSFNQYQSSGSYHAPANNYRSAASSDDAHAEIRTLQSDVRADGFDYAFETTNGIHAQQSGDAYGNVHGDFEWVSPESQHVRVVYVADENGYQPQSDALPTPPPIPDAIIRSLEYISSHPNQENRNGPPVHQVARHNPSAYRAIPVQHVQTVHHAFGRRH